MTERKKPTTDALADVVNLRAGEAVEPDAPARSSWSPVDLEDALAGGETPPPAILHRTDGAPTLYAGKTHAFIGHSESGKTWAALVAAVEVLAGGGWVLWIDFEDNAHTTVARLRALGADVDAIRSRFHYLNPAEQLMNRTGAFTAAAAVLAELLKANTYALAVVDGVTEGMAVEGLNPLDNVDIAAWNARLLNQLATAGSAVVSIDHIPKNTEGKARGGIGGQHKVSGLTGAGYLFEVRQAFRRAKDEPVTGYLDVWCTKDRPGWVRYASPDGGQPIFKWATLQLTAYPDGGIIHRLLPADKATTAPPAAIQHRILSYVTSYEGASTNAIKEGVKGKTATVLEALNWLRESGYIKVDKVGTRGGHAHTITDAGTELLEALDAGQ